MKEIWTKRIIIDRPHDELNEEQKEAVRRLQAERELLRRIKEATPKESRLVVESEK